MLLGKLCMLSFITQSVETVNFFIHENLQRPRMRFVIKCLCLENFLTFSV